MQQLFGPNRYTHKCRAQKWTIKSLCHNPLMPLIHSEMPQETLWGQISVQLVQNSDASKDRHTPVKRKREKHSAGGSALHATNWNGVMKRAVGLQDTDVPCICKVVVNQEQRHTVAWNVTQSQFVNSRHRRCDFLTGCMQQPTVRSQGRTISRTCIVTLEHQRIPDMIYSDLLMLYRSIRAAGEAMQTCPDSCQSRTPTLAPGH